MSDIDLSHQYKITGMIRASFLGCRELQKLLGGVELRTYA
jgi:hypothetical protein